MEKNAPDAGKRKEHILERLAKSEAPVSASAFARELGVSRQVIVGDIALLRASGERILSTPRGYMRERTDVQGREFTIACVHLPEQTEQELQTIVYYGGEILDVTVAHPLYGQISAPLNIGTSYEVRQFIEALQSREAALLSDLTGGVHLHRIRCTDEGAPERIRRALDDLHMIYHGEA